MVAGKRRPICQKRRQVCLEIDLRPIPDRCTAKEERALPRTTQTPSQIPPKKLFVYITVQQAPEPSKVLYISETSLYGRLKARTPHHVHAYKSQALTTPTRLQPTRKIYRTPAKYRQQPRMTKRYDRRPLPLRVRSLAQSLFTHVPLVAHESRKTIRPDETLEAGRGHQAPTFALFALFKELSRTRGRVNGGGRVQRSSKEERV